MESPSAPPRAGWHAPTARQGLLHPAPREGEPRTRPGCPQVFLGRHPGVWTAGGWLLPSLACAPYVKVARTPRTTGPGPGPTRPRHLGGSFGSWTGLCRGPPRLWP